MDPITASILAGYFTHFSAQAVQGLFSKAFARAPKLEERLRAASSTQDVESVFREAVGVIDASADGGTIDVDGALLEAIRGIRFDHGSGSVTVADSTISAPVLSTGGGPGASGTTEIRGGSRLKSKGTEIQAGRGASITITGGARIDQS